MPSVDRLVVVDDQHPFPHAAIVAQSSAAPQGFPWTAGDVWKSRRGGPMIPWVSQAAPARPRFRFAVVAVSVASAIVGCAVLATHDSGARVTTRGVTATLPLSGHPGWVAAGRDGLWIALSDTRTPVSDLPLVHLDLAGDAVVGLPLFLGGRVSRLSHVGDRLLASVDNAGGTGSGPTSIVAVDWRSGNILGRR
jgi:hypothetical protein